MFEKPTSPTSTPKVNRRLGNRKTRTGCRTCKIRRVKCGEERPSCLRCSSTGRKCDGYEDEHTTTFQSPKAIQIHSDHSTSSESPQTFESTPGTTPEIITDDPQTDLVLTQVRLEENEFHILQFFLGKAASQLADRTCLEFWNRLVPQLCYTNEAVQHAALAIGSLLLDLQRPSQAAIITQSFTQNDTSKPFAIKHYNKAIQATLSTIDQGNGGLHMAVVTCILFICVELLQGHETEALSLFYRGRTALEQSNSAEQCFELQPAKSDITSIFSKFDSQFRMFGPNTNTSKLKNTYDLAYHLSIPPVSETFWSLEHAKEELTNLVSFITSIAIIGGRLKWQTWQESDHVNFTILKARQQQLLNALNQWYTSLNALTTRMTQDSTLTPERTFTLSLLTQQHTIVQIWLACALNTSESTYDQYLPQFTNVINQATTSVESLHTFNTDTTFSFDMGWLPTLYFTTVKCRHPQLRRQAIKLLQRGWKQEGLWDARVLAKVAQRIVQIEEGLLSFEDVWVDECVGKDLPSENCRLKMVNIDLRTTMNGQQGDPVYFSSKPDGPEGEWSVRTDFCTI